MTGERCPDCGAQMLGYCLLCRIEAVPGDDRHEPTTYDQQALTGELDDAEADQ